MGVLPGGGRGVERHGRACPHALEVAKMGAHVADAGVQILGGGGGRVGSWEEEGEGEEGSPRRGGGMGRGR